MCRGAQHGAGRALLQAKRRQSSFANSVNQQVTRVCSLWARREPRVLAGGPVADNDLMLLAARHLGLQDSEQLWRLAPQGKPGKLPSVVSNTRIVYQDGVAGDRDGEHNDIWLGHARFRSYLALSLHGPCGRDTLGWWSALGEERNAGDDEEEAVMRGGFAGEEGGPAEEEATSPPDTTIFVFPYSRSNSRTLVEALHRHRAALTETDVRSLVYLCGATGSSRALRLLGQLLRENCRGHETASAIHRVEEHAWPWMNAGGPEQAAKIGVPLALDALSSAAVIRYTFEKESAIFDHIASELQKLDAKIKEGGAAVTEEVKALDGAILTRAVHLLVLKRNFSQFNSDHIRVFSDFICDRLHRIDPRSVANMAFSLGHSKHLDEFWMFMMAKRIQDSPQEFGPDELAAIMDAYSNACLEDHEFYSALCKQVALNFEHHSIEHLTVILRALARVRVRDEWLLHSTLRRLETHLDALEASGEGRAGRELAYITANCVVAAGDLGYAGDSSFDSMWRLLTARIRESSFDICAINWLPLAAMTFASRTTLQTFMPVWIRHVAHTIQKLRSKTFVLTIQRRHHLVRHVFKLGILPLELLPKTAQRVLDDICDREFVTGQVREEYVPESSTFHLEVCACLRALDVAHQREINIVPFVMDIVVPPKVSAGRTDVTFLQKEYRIKSPQICEANRLSDRARSGQADELSAAGFRLKRFTCTAPTMDEMESYRNRHHQAYLSRKKAAGEPAGENSSVPQAAPAEADTAVPPRPAVSTAAAAPQVEEELFGSSVSGDVEGFEGAEHEGDPLYESSVALARSLQEELNRQSPRVGSAEEVRAPDSLYQDRMIPVESEDAELQAAIAHVWATALSCCVLRAASEEGREYDPRGRQQALVPDVVVHVGRGDEVAAGAGGQRKGLARRHVVEDDGVGEPQNQVVNLELAQHHHPHRLAKYDVDEPHEQVDQDYHDAGLGRREGAAEHAEQQAVEVVVPLRLHQQVGDGQALEQVEAEELVVEADGAHAVLAEHVHEAHQVELAGEGLDGERRQHAQGPLQERAELHGVDGGVGDVHDAAQAADAGDVAAEVQNLQQAEGEAAEEPAALEAVEERPLAERRQQHRAVHQQLVGGRRGDGGAEDEARRAHVGGARVAVYHNHQAREEGRGHGAEHAGELEAALGDEVVVRVHVEVGLRREEASEGVPPLAQVEPQAEGRHREFAVAPQHAQQHLAALLAGFVWPRRRGVGSGDAVVQLFLPGVVQLVRAPEVARNVRNRLPARDEAEGVAGEPRLRTGVGQEGHGFAAPLRRALRQPPHELRLALRVAGLLHRLHVLVDHALRGGVAGDRGGLEEGALPPLRAVALRQLAQHQAVGAHDEAQEVLVHEEREDVLPDHVHQPVDEEGQVDEAEADEEGELCDGEHVDVLALGHLVGFVRVWVRCGWCFAMFEPDVVASDLVSEIRGIPSLAPEEPECLTDEVVHHEDDVPEVDRRREGEVRVQQLVDVDIFLFLVEEEAVGESVEEDVYEGREVDAEEREVVLCEG
ncbi:uncharacterized protein BcabD6B2_35580 [Babesia caballi]|uniref:Uncharacterized protein n=1 Tax=Babesia caballi TaxID=5871 RepID=A0AAV4LVC3_BABCB|nr:hypothetical protein, conserved [Babesia caballi]